MGLAQDWSEWLREAIREFARTRRVASPVVKIVLADEESFFIQHVTAGPGDDLVTFSVYPPGLGQAVLDALVPGEDGELMTPRAVIVHVGRVGRVELLTEAPGRAAVGFVTD